jgi:hypothetical protein
MENNEFQILSDKIDELTKLIDSFIKKPSTGKFINKSSGIELISTALAKAQASYKPIIDLKENTYTEIAYASMQQIIDATRDALTENGLAVVQVIFDYPEDACQMLHTQLIHTSGQFFESQMMVKPNGNDPAAITSYINWLKRTAYSAIVCCAIPKEDDDAVRHAKMLGEGKSPLRGSAAKRKNESYDRVNKQQYEEIALECDGYPELAEMLMRDYEIDDLHELNQDVWRKAITKIRENKLLLKGR